MYKLVIIILILFGLCCSFGCKNDKGCTDPLANNYDPMATEEDGSCEYGYVYNPTPYQLDLPPLLDQFVPSMFISNKNPLTVEGVELGKKLFHDTLLDGYSSATKLTRFSCSTCHKIDYAFGGNDSVVPLFNLGWSNVWKWNGKVDGTVEDLFVFEIEHFMHTNLNEFNANPTYKELFKNAFNVNYISYKEIEYALSQYFRTFISGNSKFDKYLETVLLGIPNQVYLTPSELNGFNIFMDGTKGDCFHCHGSSYNPLWTDNKFHNNGLDAVPDLGLQETTGNPNDRGKFKTPTVRNLAFTAPYMHDGRFNTIDEVIDFYSSGVKMSPTIDPLMQFASQGGVQLTPQEKADLKAFLLTLTDSTILSNPQFQSPF